MSDAVTATRAQIQIGSIAIDGFMLPDGSYQMSQAQVANCIGDDAVYARNFLKSKTLKSLRGEGYTPETFDVNSEEQSRGQTRIQGWPLDIVYAFWVYRCFRGNKNGFNLIIALGTESLERRFDQTFDIDRTEEERNDRLAQHMGELEGQMSALSEAYAEPDDLREIVSRLENQVRQLGGEPWTVSDDDD